MDREVLSDQDITEKIKRVFAQQTEGWPSRVYTAGDISHHSMIPISRVRKMLPTLVDSEALVSLREEGDLSLLSNVYGARRGATYYMLPERLEELKAARIKRQQRPFQEQARELILEKYKVEVEAEFTRLWDEYVKSLEG